MKIIHVFPRFRRFGGAQRVILDLMTILSVEWPNYMSGFQKFDDIDDFYKKTVKREKYLQFSFENIMKLKDAVVISHDRKLTTILVLLNFFIRFELIHVAHGVYYSHKYLTLLPRRIIAVSEAIKTNLESYFGVTSERISVIYNGVRDSHKGGEIIHHRNKVPKILFLGQIDENKQQLNVVEYLNSINANITIDFAGEGPKSGDLQEYISRHKIENKFRLLGFVEEPHSIIKNYDFLMLFSVREGLGISLIESCMMGRPVITKGSGGSAACREICLDKENGFILTGLEDLKFVLAEIDSLNEKEYRKMCHRARDIYLEKFSFEKMKGEYLKYIKLRSQ